MNTSKAIRDRLFARTGKGIKYDLERMVQASMRCGDAFRAFKSIHVAGTNGKGSTCAYLESMIRHQEYTTGLYTSPHLLRFEERFVINGKPVSELQWIDVYNDMQQVIDDLDLTFFEATTLMAYELFKRNDVEWAVVETGMGGRLDATNIIVPCVSVITSIDIDHKEYLGSTLGQIAGEKFGIIKEGVPVVMAVNKDPSVMSAASACCMKKGAALTLVSDEMFHVTEHESGVTLRDEHGIDYEVSMKGSFQVINAALAINAFREAGFIFDERAQRGLRSTFLPGRMQEFQYHGKTVCIDVGHNPHAADALVKELSKRYPGKSICIVAGIMADKDYKSMIDLYLTITERLILTQPEIPRAASTELLMSNVPCCKMATSIRNVSAACREALSGTEAVLCITGSFYTVGEACVGMGFNPFTGNTL